MSTNLVTTIYERFYAAAREQSLPPPWFRPDPPTVPGSPSAPTYPGNLNSLERAEVELWLASSASQRPAILARSRSRLVIATIGAYVTYYADPAIIAWQNASDAARIAQWRLYMGDAIVNNKATTSKSADVAGTGSTPPPADQPPATNV